MAELLKGAPVAAAIAERLKEEVDELRAGGTVPVLAIVRVGEKQNDLAYERSAMKKCDAVGIEVRNEVFPEDISNEDFLAELERINGDDSVHGVLMFRPLPDHLDMDAACRAIRTEKDVDGATSGSMAGVFAGEEEGFPPCTAQAVLEILDHYGMECAGKHAVVMGRSLVVGRPAALMLMQRNATVTVCHTRTKDTPALARQADILVTCIGQPESIGTEYLKEGQTVIDVGLTWSEEKGRLCGDVDPEAAEPVVSAITPARGGVGAVTSTVLLKHVVEAAQRTLIN